MQVIRTKHLTLNILRRVPKSEHYSNTAITLRLNKERLTFNLTIKELQLFYISIDR